MKILITGALGQIGTELATVLGEAYGTQNIILSDIKKQINNPTLQPFRYYTANVLDGRRIAQIITSNKITTIYHLAAILSATAEEMPLRAWDINMGGLINILEISRESNCRLFVPSSIGAFGPTTPKKLTPQTTVQRPVSIYGISKVAGELLCDYYHLKYGVDTRGVRFPGIISSSTPPGGGTTDYAVEMYYGALETNSFVCPLKPNTRIDMMYMPDALKGIMKLMSTPEDKLVSRNAYNITAMNFTPGEQAIMIKSFLPNFKITYDTDPVKQEIADSWPDSIDDTQARMEWGWKPEYDLYSMTKDMLSTISKNIKIQNEEKLNDRNNKKQFQISLKQFESARHL